MVNSTERPRVWLEGSRELDASSVFMHGTRLEGARLQGARLKSAILQGARLQGARLGGTIVDWCQGLVSPALNCRDILRPVTADQGGLRGL